MRKRVKITSLLLCIIMLVGCDTEVAEFDSVKDAIETAERETPKDKPETDKIIDNTIDSPEVITKDNNPEFKRLLDGGVTSSEYADFFNANMLSIIEFDGAIDGIELLPDKKTRYSLLLRSGDYDINSVCGPAMVVRDVGGSDKSVRDIFTTGNAAVGKQVHIVAKIQKYNTDTDSLEITLESMTLR